jgi:hypothetical protein
MKVPERKRKFNKFVQLSQDGSFSPSETARKLGVSIGTLYNWRNRLRDEVQPVKQDLPQPLPAPSFTRFAIEPIRTPSCIEITVGKNIVIHISEQVPADVLNVLLDRIVLRGRTQ